MRRFYEYFDKGIEWVGKAMRVPHPVYKALGIEKLVKLSEGVLGELNEKSRKDVEAGYAMATGFLIAGDVTGNPFCIAASSLMYPPLLLTILP